jgi:hypothetical protein
MPRIFLFYPRVFAELIKEHKKIPKYPFTENEIGFLTLVLFREEVLFFAPSCDYKSLPSFTSRDSIAMQDFILASRNQFVEFYTKRHKKISK